MLHRAQGAAGRSSCARAKGVGRQQLRITAAAYPGDAYVRSYTNCTFYKPQAAVKLKPIPPSFVPMTGQNGTYYQLDREGSLLLEFADAQSQSSWSESGNRTYNWQGKQNFALKALELSELVDFDTWAEPNSRQGSSLEFVHDPSKANPSYTQPGIRKTLRLAVLPAGHRAGYILSLDVLSSNSNTLIEVSLTRPEFVAVKSMATYLIPRMYGFEYLFEMAGQQPNVTYQAAQQQQQQTYR